jgi:hypothetical protein
VPTGDRSCFFATEIAFLAFFCLFATWQTRQVEVQPEISAPIVLQGLTRIAPDEHHSFTQLVDLL